MGKVKQWCMETQEKEFMKQWEDREKELLFQFIPLGYSYKEVVEILDAEKEDAQNEWEQEQAHDNADSWETPNEQ